MQQKRRVIGMAGYTIIADVGNTLVKILVENKPMANIMDNKPMVNILPFGMCQCLANPQVAALGVLTPMPCIPMITAPWTPGSLKTLVKGQPGLTNSSKLMCNWGGVIQFTNPGTTKTQMT